MTLQLAHSLPAAGRPATSDDVLSLQTGQLNRVRVTEHGKERVLHTSGAELSLQGLAAQQAPPCFQWQEAAVRSRES